jgi:hypothetical protein
MSKITRVGLILVIVLTCFSFAPRAAQAYGGSSSTCSSLSLSGNGSGTTIVTFNGTFDAGDAITITFSPSSPYMWIELFLLPDVFLGGSYSNSLTVSLPDAMTGDFWVAMGSPNPFSYSIGCAPSYQGLHATDGRINAWDVGYAPVAIYQSSTGIKIYAVDPATGKSVLVLTVLQTKINTTDATAQNVLLDEAPNPFSGQMISLYMLTTGEFSLVTADADGKPYVGVWATGASDFYHP